MSGHRNIGGTPGWRAPRGTCPVCGRDTATGIDYRPSSDPLAGRFRTIKRHGSPPCTGVGRRIPTAATRHPET